MVTMEGALMEGAQVMDMVGENRVTAVTVADIGVGDTDGSMDVCGSFRRLFRLRL